MFQACVVLALLCPSVLCSFSHGSSSCDRELKELQDSVISVKSPNYPLHYAGNLNCSYKIKLRKNYKIKLTFNEVKLQKKDKKGRCRDYLRVYDGLKKNSQVIQKTFCGNGVGVVNKEINSLSNKMTINFVSDDRHSNKGFQFSYRAIPVCPDDIIRESRRGIKSLDYPSNYTNNLKCNYKIELPKNTRIQLIFREVKLQKKDADGKCRDYIEVYDGHATWARVIQKQFCGNGKGVVNHPIISGSNKLMIQFITDEKYTDKGFELTYDPYEPPKDVTQGVTGVVIGTACGLVFLILTFLAICHSRHLSVLRRHGRRYEITSTSGPTDVVEERAPPSYEDVMSSPEKYPPTPSGPKQPRRFLKAQNGSESSGGEDEPPRYSKLIFDATPSGDSEPEQENMAELQSISRSISTDV